MHKFRVDLAFDEDTDEEIPFKEVELPLERDAFRTACLDLEEEVYREHGADRTVSITVISALRDITIPSINPDASPIKQGDVVWRDWDDFANTDTPEDVSRMHSALAEYKPLWEKGPGCLLLVEILNEDDWE